MQFLWPDSLWLLLIVPLLIAAYFHALRSRKKVTVRYASLALVRDAIGPGQWLRRHLPPLLLLGALIFALVGIARPSAVITLPSEYQTIVLAVDVSRSMRANDMPPSRIEAAQNAVRAFIRDLPPNVRVGLVTFAGTAAVVQTPTTNRDDLLAAVDRFQLQHNTATGTGLLMALSLLLPDAGIDLEAELFDRNFSRRAGGMPVDAARSAERKDFKPVPPGSYTSGAIVLLSDGRRTMGPDPLAAAKLAAERGVRVHTVGFGSKEGGPVSFDHAVIYMRFDEEALKAIAGITEGEYFHAGSSTDLQRIYNTLTAKMTMERDRTELSALFGSAAALFALLAGALSLVWVHRPS